MMRTKLREALTMTINELRPSWELAGIRKALDHPDLAMVNETAVAVAAIRAAADPKNRTPAVIAMQGPHWETPAAQVKPNVPPPFQRPPALTDAEQAAADQAAAVCRQTLTETRTR